MTRSSIYRHLLAPLPATGREPVERADLQLRIRATKARLAYAAMWSVLLAGVAAVALVVLTMSFAGDGWQLEVSTPSWIWALATTVSLFARLGISFWFKTANLSDEDAVRHTRLYVWNGAFAGLAWGSSSFVLLPAHTLEQEGFLPW